MATNGHGKVLPQLSYQLDALLHSLKKSVSLWFSFNDGSCDSYGYWPPILTGCVDILMNGVHLLNARPTANDIETRRPDAQSLRKLIDDFEWVCRAAEVRRDDADAAAPALQNDTQTTTPSAALPSMAALFKRQAAVTPPTVEDFLLSWTERNLKANCLCSCLQALVAERELLELHYEAAAFLRSERHATALFICLSALELNQCSLLSQIEFVLNTTATSRSGGGLQTAHFPETQSTAHKHGHKRSFSQPNFAIMPPKITFTLSASPKKTSTLGQQQQQQSKKPLPAPSLQMRKVKSLPNFPPARQSMAPPSDVPLTSRKLRQRSKTFSSAWSESAANMPATQPKNIPQVRNALQQKQLAAWGFRSAGQDTSSSSYTSHSGDDDLLPSTSASSLRRNRRQTANLNLLESRKRATVIDEVSPETRASAVAVNATTITTTATSSSLANSSRSSSSLGSAATRRIQLIKCDDIKIWTDQGRESKPRGSTGLTAAHSLVASSDKPPPPAVALPIVRHTTKSVSPISSFLSSMFSTPPTYTSWSNSTFRLVDDEMSATETAVAAADMPDVIMVNDSMTTVYPWTDESISNSTAATTLNRSSSVSMFDTFMPVDGKKLRSRTSQNLFDDRGGSVDTYSCNSSVTATGSERRTADKMQQTTKTCTSSSSNEALSAGCGSGSNSDGHQAQDLVIPRVPPKNYQSLTRFLQMAQLSRNNTDLEKENAHFRIAEAIISVIEHIKCAKLDAKEREHTNNGRTSSPALATATDWLNRAGDAQEHAEEIPRIGLATQGKSDRTVSESTEEYIPYAEDGKSCLDMVTAEVVGLSLISRFNDRQLPKVSELKWLVSEEDAPQQLLPMPDDSPTSNPDENVIPSVTRGTHYWAPPRQQIIFTEHPPPNRKELIRKQNNRCAGCGMRTSRRYLQSFRYCTYLGKYHCTGCHRNQISALPAKILHNWDFKCYPVSVFAYRLLEQMYTYPLFHVPDLNAALYVRAKELRLARDKRWRLSFVKDFIRSCRFTVREQLYFDNIPSHIADDIDMWSMSDFTDTHQGSLQRSIDELIARCEEHIFNCVLCTARGFICEHCRKEHILYPWQAKIMRCERCGSCFHQKCWKSMMEMCCRCQRIIKRQIEINDAL